MEQELQQAQEIYDVVTNFLITYSFQIFGALVLLVIGIFIAGKISGFILNMLMKHDIDVTLSRFTASGVKVLVIVMVAIMALGKVGVSVTPFVAAIGALSLGAGLALQGLLSNYSAGVCIIITRPFVVGDTIVVQGVAGLVKEVHLAFTLLTDEDGVEITIPNKYIVGEIISNSHEDSVLELTVGIAYDSDTEKAISAILNALKPLEGISSEREPQVGIDEFASSSINIGVRVWAKTELFFDTKYKVNAAIFKALNDNAVEIPFPRQNLHIIEKTS